jgi:hypothetical protein
MGGGVSRKLRKGEIKMRKNKNVRWIGSDISWDEGE